jgi:murein peptide amidase A
MRRLIIVVLLLLQPLAAQEVIEMKDTDGDGWPEFVSGEHSAVSPGPLVLKLCEGREDAFASLVLYAADWPNSRQILVRLARESYAVGDSPENTRLIWKLAREAEDIDFRLEAARYYYSVGQWGEAMELMAVGDSMWMSRMSEILKKDIRMARLFASGWEVPVGATTLQRDGVELRLGPMTKEAREVRVGSASLGLGETVVTLPDIGLQLQLSSPEEVDTLAAELAGSQGIVEQLGLSVEGRPIEAVWFGSGSQTVVYFGAFHGDEPESAEVVQEFADYLRANPEVLEDRRAVLVPVVNPDGLRRKQRKNFNQVDLNRNFPTSNWKSEGKETNYWGGTGPASEPETRVVIDLLKRFQPDRIISIHCPYKCVNYDGPAERLAQAMSAENGYSVEASIGYPTPGSFGNYAGVEKQIPTITLELPPTGEEDVWGDNREALLKALRGVE